MTTESTKTAPEICKDFWIQFRPYFENTELASRVLGKKTSKGKPVFSNPKYYDQIFFDIHGVGKILATVLAGRATKSGKERKKDKNGGCVEILLEKNDKATDKAIFDYLKNDEITIERKLGFKLKWGTGSDTKRYRITRHNPFNPRCVEEWEEHNKWFIETVEAFERVFIRRLEDMNISK